MTSDAEGPDRGERASQPFRIENLNQLIKLMNENRLTEIQIRDGDKEVRLVRAAPAPVPARDAPVAPPTPPDVPAVRPMPDTSGQWPPEPQGDRITSPMVGTFYSGSSPEADPYVTVGTRVEQDTVVCLIEAMKVFNEIHAETQGTIVEVLVENGTPVEYGQPLFVVEPDQAAP